MRHLQAFTVLVVGVTACAGRAPQSTLTAAAKSSSYRCGDRVIERTGDRVTSGVDRSMPLGWSDTQGRHFVSWPDSATALETIEYVIPDDRRADAIERVYDTSSGRSRNDWRLIAERTCVASSGYNHALSLFAAGKSFDQVAQEIGSDKYAARDLVHHALLSIQKRYYKDR